MVGQLGGDPSGPSWCRSEILLAVDGHGECGHHLSERICWTLPYYLAMELPKAKNAEDVPSCISKAFDRCHAELVKYAMEEKVDITFSGSTVIAAIVAGGNVWVASTGDSRAFLAAVTPTGPDAGRVQIISTTVDHTVSIPSEMERVIANGGRVESEVSEEDGMRIDRVYLKDEHFPGLRLSRAFGDLCLHAPGVTTHKPDVSKWQANAASDGTVLILVVASDGVWEFLENTEVAEKISAVLALRAKQQLDLKHSASKAAQIVAGQAEGTWTKSSCGGLHYKDDITVLVKIFSSAA